MRQSTRRQALGLAVLAGIALVAAVAFSPARFLRELEHLAAHPVLFVVALTAVYLLRPLVVWPISAVSVLVGYVYGPQIGFTVALVGAVGTCVPPFLLARYATGGKGVFADLGATGERLVEVTGEFRGVFAGRLAPLPADAVSYAAGLSGVSASAFLGATFIGEIPWVTAAVFAGASMRELTLRGLQNGLPLVVGAASLAVLVLAGPAYRHFRTDGEPL
jgi:uncharacterized membrane protein YdjX (TVP38/TMEM64 family)